jgi:hypothetical protein
MKSKTQLAQELSELKLDGTNEENDAELFREACNWLGKKAPEGVDPMRWLVQHGLVTEDREWLTERGRRSLERMMDQTNDIADHLMTIIGKSVEDLKRDFASELADLYLARKVANGALIRLDNDNYIEAEHFDPSKHKRAQNIRLLEMTRADIESFIAADDDGRRYQWSLLLSVAELAGWPEKGSPAIWLLEREYLERSERGFRWTEKATRNKKLGGKLRQLPALFSPERAKTEARLQ